MLRRSLLSLVLVLAVASSLAAFQEGEWVKLAPAESGFSVMMPGKAEEELQRSDDFTLHLYSVSTPAGIYMASYGDYAPRINLDSDGELAANRDNFLKGLNARLIETRNITLNGYKGVEFTGENDMTFFKSRVYINGNRVYQIMTAVDTGKDDSANVNRFFASFAFIKTNPVHKP
jgi:hypothetical protein